MFDAVFCEGARNALADFIRGRFNMDGADTTTRKVGLLDKYQVWSFICDPHRELLVKQLNIEPSRTRCVKDMFDFFGKEMEWEQKQKILYEFREYYAQSGLWMDYFEHSKMWR